jgi:L-asparagine oxygenase
MAPALAAELDRCGYAFLPMHSPGADSAAVATSVGKPLVPWEGGLIQQLVPRATATPNTYSGIYGFDRFPFHTDLAHWRQPPRYLLLRCLRGYADVPTLLVDCRAVFDSGALEILTRAIVKPRRPQNGSIPLLRLCEQIEDGHRFRWDETFLTPASRLGDLASQQVRATLESTKPRAVALAQPGDTLIVDNWRMLHARSSVLAGREDRALERVYLESIN